MAQAFETIERAIEDLPDEETSLGPESLPAPVINPDEIAFFSDGACRGNPGPGSWAFIAQDHQGNIVQKASGVSEVTTNNKMELQGVIEGLSFLEECPDNYQKIYYYTDSRYVVDGITSWAPGWKRRGWKKADKKTPENLEQWKRLDELNERFSVEFIWVKGHSGHPQNELCDQMANEALDAQGF
ncbi:MAG: ribonuclease HI [Bacteriovoracaceae bacterium]